MLADVHPVVRRPSRRASVRRALDELADLVGTILRCFGFIAFRPTRRRFVRERLRSLFDVRRRGMIRGYVWSRYRSPFFSGMAEAINPNGSPVEPHPSTPRRKRTHESGERSHASVLTACSTLSRWERVGGVDVSAGQSCVWTCYECTSQMKGSGARTPR